MRNYLIVIFLFIIVFCTAQNQKEIEKKFSFSTAGIQPISVGNNFVAKGYEKSLAFSISAQYKFNHHAFFGFEYQKVPKAIVNTYWIGDFEYATTENIILFGGYYYRINQNFYLDHRAGFGATEIIHEGGYSGYKITGYKFLIGSKLHYKLDDTFDVFSQLDFVYTKYEVEISGPKKSFYTTGLQFMPALGIRVNIGEKSTNSK